MKKFLRKVFFWDDPAAGAVFGWMLSVVFGFCYANSTEVVSLRPGPEMSDHLLYWGVWGVRLLLAVYTLFLSSVFFFRQDKTRFKKFFWGLVVIYIAVFYLCPEFLLELRGVFICITLFFAGFNALCIRKKNFGWYIAQLLCCIACFPGVMILIDAVKSLDGGEVSASLPIATAWRVPTAYSAVLFFIGFMICNFKLWASADNRRLRDVWGVGCNVLLMLLAVFYLSMLAVVYVQQKKCQDALTALETGFRRPISAEALKEIYYSGRKTDEDFHVALKKAWDDFCPGKDSYLMLTGAASFAAPLSAKYQNTYFSPQAERVVKFFDAPLPARRRDYSEGKLDSTGLSEFGLLRHVARMFAWRVRIACDNKDHGQMMRSWRSSAFITEYLARDTCGLAALVLITVEQIRLDILEVMLASRMLTDGDLLEIQQSLQKSVKQISELKHNVLYFEVTIVNDSLCRLVNSCDDSEAVGVEGIKNYRFLAPGLWYWAARNYCDWLICCNVEDICHIDGDFESSPENILSSMLSLPWISIGEKMKEMEMRYQAFTVLIEAEKIKRKTGKYPEKLPLNITDRFSGEPLRYRVGDYKKYWIEEKNLDDAEEQDKEPLFKTVRGVAVWSVGKNKTDDNGLAGADEDGNRGDDLRALLVVSQ